ncbi:MAG: sigma-70 family RNA polymerase sigma factor [Acidimicrobiia bacterium]|nr:sigma-70 family RNA polymerase sigma factor [Acidimicrobiia bacterium]
MSPPPFQRFLDEHSGPVYRFLVAFVGANDADDCFQETFLSAWRSYPRLEHDDNLRGWILTVAHRKALDHHRDAARRRRTIGGEPKRTHGSTGQFESAIWESVRALPPKQRDAVLHRYVSDLPYRRIGELIGCSEAAARRNAHEGIAKLKKEHRQ